MNDFRNAEHYPDPTPHEALKNIENENNIRRGDIYEIHKHVNRDTGEKSDEKMLCVIVSNDDINTKSGFVEYVLISDIQFDGYETTVPINRAGIKGCAVCSKISTCGKNKIGDLVSVCFDDELKAIDAALLASLGMSRAAEVAPPCDTAYTAAAA